MILRRKTPGAPSTTKSGSNTFSERRMQLRLLMRPLKARLALSFVALLVVGAGIVWATGVPKTLSGLRLTDTTSCQFQKADQPLRVAFCESFSQPMGSAGNRSGDLNAQVWGVSRIIAGGGENYSSGTNPSQGQIDAFAPVNLQTCGTTQTVFPDRDVQICSHQVFEGVNDDGGQTVLAMYPKQPFDVAGRTGTVTFDVSANSEGPHAAWPTFVYTDQPVPAPYSSASGIQTSARNSFGFTLAQTCGAGSWCGADCGAQGSESSIDTMFVTRNYKLSDLSFDRVGCVKQPTSPTQLNHFEVRISQSEIDVWGSDPGSTALRLIAQAKNVNLPLTRGLVWMEDTHYNANKFNNQQSHTFGWSNLGFDGPVLSRDLAFDVPDEGEMNVDSRWPGHSAKQLGWSGNTNLQVQGLYNVDKAAAAIVTFNYQGWISQVPTVSVNGNAAISTPWLSSFATFQWNTIAVPVPLSEIHAGTNTIAFGADDNTAIANVDLILVGAGGIPTCFDPSNCAGTPVNGNYVSAAGGSSSTGTGSTGGSSSGGSTSGGTGGSVPSSSGGSGSSSGGGSPQPHPTPTPSGAMFGLASIGTVSDNGDTNCLNGSRISTGGSAVKLKSISVYVPQVEDSPKNQYSVAIYSNDWDNHPLNLIAKSAVGTLTPTAWNTLPINANLQPNTYYWIMYFTNGENNMPYNDSHDIVGAWSCPGDFNNGAAPASLDSSHETGKWQYSMYATVE